jgi:hypothetical protein
MQRDNWFDQAPPHRLAHHAVGAANRAGEAHCHEIVSRGSQYLHVKTQPLDSSELRGKGTYLMAPGSTRKLTWPGSCPLKNKAPRSVLYRGGEPGGWIVLVVGFT